MYPEFKTVAVGGTFDEFHEGHKALLRKAFEIGKHVLVGLSSDDFVRKMKKPHSTATYAERLKELKAFLLENGLLKRAEIVCLNDAYGVTLAKEDLEALVVSKEKESVAAEINERRRRKDLTPLVIVVIDMITSEDDVPISTTRIRQRQIDRDGTLLHGLCSRKP